MLHLDRTITWPHLKLETVSAEQLQKWMHNFNEAPQLDGPYTRYKHAHQYTHTYVTYKLSCFINIFHFLLCSSVSINLFPSLFFLFFFSFLTVVPMLEY